MYVGFVAHGVPLFIEQGLFTNFEILCFALKCTIFIRMEKVFIGYVEWAYRHLHVKYLSNWIILKFSHKLAHNC